MPTTDAIRSTFNLLTPSKYIESTLATEKVTMPGSKSHTAHELSAKEAPKKSTTTKGVSTASAPAATMVSPETTRQTASVIRSASSLAEDATRGARTIPAALARYHTISASPVPTE